MRRLPRIILFRCLIIRMALLLLASGAGVAQQDDSGVGAPRFDIWEIQVVGNTRLESRDIERAVYPHLGPERSIDDVVAAQRDLEELYREAGYGVVLVNIPEQNVEAGVVRLNVVEGRVGRLRVSDADYFSPRRIKQAVPSLARGKILYLPNVQDELTAVNKASRDRVVTPVLRPGREEGTVEVDLKVDDKLPLHGFVEVNDRYTRDTSRTRINASLTYGNLWQREHSLGLGYQTAPDDTSQVEAFYGTYLFGIPRTDWLLTFYGVKSDSDVATVGTLGVIGNGTILGARATRPLGLVGGGFHNLIFGIDYKDFKESVALTDAPRQETPIKYWVASAAYALTFGDDDRFTRFSTDAIFAPRFLNNQDQFFAISKGPPPEISGKRVGSRANFAALRFGLTHRRALPMGMELEARLYAQLADSPLINNEQFTYGGIDSVRGYLEAQQFSDNGIAGQLELYSPDWGQWLWAPLNSRFLVFFDAGLGHVQDALPGVQSYYDIYSSGVGWDLEFWGKLTGVLDWAYPFQDSEDGEVRKGDHRLHFYLRYGF